MAELNDHHSLTLQNLTVDSESQFSLFYLHYNYYTLPNNDPDLSNTTNFFTITNTDNLVKFIIQGIFLSLITGLGMIGNIFSIIVLLNRKMKSSISCFLIGLAICDIFILGTTLVMLGLPTIFSFEPLNPGLTSVYLSVGFIVPMLYSLSTTALTGSTYFTIFVTIERYLVVCHPFLSRRICTWRRACQASVVIFLLSILYNGPRWFHYTCESVFNNNGENIGCWVKATQFRRNQDYNFFYIYVSHGIVHYYIPGTVLLVLNLLIYLKIRKANLNRRAISISESKKDNLTHMLFVVVAVFISCNFMFGAAVTYKIFTWQKPLPISTTGSVIGIFLLVLNSSLNFLIYCYYGEKFREVLFDLMAQPWRRLTASRQRSNSDMSTSISALAGSTCSLAKWLRSTKGKSTPPITVHI